MTKSFRKLFFISGGVLGGLVIGAVIPLIAVCVWILLSLQSEPPFVSRCDEDMAPQAVIEKCSQEIEKLEAGTEQDFWDSYASPYDIRGKAYLEVGEYDKAIADFDEAVGREPSARAYEQRADALISKGSYSRAISDLTEAIELSRVDGRPAPYFARSRAYQRSGDYQRAVGDLKSGLYQTTGSQLGPEELKLSSEQSMLLQTYLEKRPHGLYSDFARKVLGDPIDVDSSDQSSDEKAADPVANLIAQGKAKYEKGDYEAAILDFTSAIDRGADVTLESPSDNKVLILRARAYNANGNHSLAIEDAIWALKFDPQSADAYYELGFANYAKGNHLEAVSNIKSAVKLDPTKAEALLPDFAERIGAEAAGGEKAVQLVGRGLVHQVEGDLVQAIAEYDAAIKREPESVFAYNLRSMAYNEKGEFDRAIADSTKAIEINSKYVDAYINRGRAYLDTHKYALADADVHKALEMDERNNEAYRLSRDIDRAKASAEK